MPLSAKKRSFRSLGAAVFELLAISSKNLTSKFRLTSDPFFGHFRSENRKSKGELFLAKIDLSAVYFGPLNLGSLRLDSFISTLL